MNEENQSANEPEAPQGDYSAAETQEALVNHIAELQAENQALKDRMMRTLADMENLRRRTEKEKADASLYGISKFARDILAVADNLSRALGSLPEEARENANDAVKALIEGVELTERDMINQLERHNVKKISPKGEKFDPNFHQAMFEAPDTSVPNNTVIEVVQDGYVIGQRVLRPALVGVAKGGAKIEAIKPEAKEKTQPQAENETLQGKSEDAQPEMPSKSTEGHRVDRTV